VLLEINNLAIAVALAVSQLKQAGLEADECFYIQN
jgi:hypothetical protein